MSDSNHNEPKEAFEDGLNRGLFWSGHQIALASITTAQKFVTHDDGSISGPVYDTAVKFSDWALAAFTAYAASQQPAPPPKVPTDPPPTDPPPTDPPPTDPPPTDPPPTDPSEPPVDTSGFAYIRGLQVINPVYPSGLPAVGGSWSDATTGAVTMRVTDHTKLGASDNGGALRVVYSRYPNESCDKTHVLIHGVGSPTAYIQERVSRKFVCELFDVRGRAIGEADEIRWDYHTPTILRFVSGMQIWAIDIVAGTKRLIRDFSPDFPTATFIMNDVEGDSSKDSRFWCWMAMVTPTKGSWHPAAIFTYDMVTDEILGIMSFKNWGLPAGDTTGDHLPRPNMVEISPDGRYALVHWAACWGTGSNPNTAYNGNLALTHADGPHCYPLSFDVSKAVKMAPDATHGAWALGFDKKWRLVSQNNAKGEAKGTSGGDWIEAVDPDLGWRSDGQGVIRILNQAQLGWSTGYHFCGATGMPGWVLMSTYSSQQIDPGDNQLMLLPLTNQGNVLRVAPTYSIHDEVLQSGYFQEAPACMSDDGLRIYWSGNFGGAAKTDVYSITLPDDWQARAGA